MSQTIFPPDADEPLDPALADLFQWAMEDPDAAEVAVDRMIVETDGLRGFIPLSWHVVEGSEKKFISNWHIDEISDYLEGVSAGHIKRLAIAMPPRHMKSLSVAVAWPAWDWLKNPWRQFLFASYAHGLSIRDSVRCRRIIQSPWYQRRWGDKFRLTGDQNTKIRFENDKNGYRLATSVDGQLTGEGGDIIVCLPGDEVVHTEDGPIEIERIVSQRLQIKVWSYDVRSCRTALKPIIGWHRNAGRPILKITLGDGTSFRCTGDHRVWTIRGWVVAGCLQASDVLPGAPIADIRDGLGGDAELPSQGPMRLSGGQNQHDVFLRERRPGGFFAPRAVAGSALVCRDAVPCFAPPDLLDGAWFNAITLPQRLRRFAARGDLLSLHAGEYGAWARFKDWKGPVQLGIVDVLRACSVFQVAQSGIARIAALVSNLLAGWRRANKSQHDNLVDEQLRGLAVATSVEPGISMVGRRLDQASRNLHRPPSTLSYSRFASNSTEVRNVVAWEARDRSPQFIEIVGHADATYCLTVADYHTMMVGQHGYVILRNCDDAHNVRQAESEATREGTLTWWDEAMSSRLNDPKTGAYVLIQQRVHERDLMGHVLTRDSPESWTYLCLPLEFEPDHPHRWFRDPRKEAGELLWPARSGRVEVETLKASLGPYAAAAQLQQRPSPREGGIFKRGWFKFLDVAPADLRSVRGWDLAATEKKLIKSDPDYTASVKAGWSPSLKAWVITHVERFREEPHEVEKRIKQRSDLDGIGVQIQIPQDPGQAGKSQVKNLVTMLSRYSVHSQTVTGDKMARAMAWAGKVGAGLVYLVKDTSWNEMFLTEITGFPTGAHDDMVDAASSAFERLVNTTFGISEYFEQQLRDAGIDPASLKTPYEAQQEALAQQEEERLKAQGQTAQATPLTQALDMAAIVAALAGRKPGQP